MEGRGKTVFPRRDAAACAAATLGMSLTALKQVCAVCRKLGIPRWPYQRPTKHAKLHKHGKRHRATRRAQQWKGRAGSRHLGGARGLCRSILLSTPLGAWKRSAQTARLRGCDASHRRRPSLSGRARALCRRGQLSDSGDSYTSAVTVDTQRVASIRGEERCEDEAGECTRTCSVHSCNSAVSMASTAAPSAHYRGMAHGPCTLSDLAPCAAAARAPARHLRSMDSSHVTADDHLRRWVCCKKAGCFSPLPLCLRFNADALQHRAAQLFLAQRAGFERLPIMVITWPLWWSAAEPAPAWQR
jgi:hypothetical protein